ncbi:cytochrome b561 [Nitzschia inconspicua]|uniref:Cytochrome b561 n=1 Tax=Nitzschia inconspicua TaxID=303405 RepID=A0A9K3KWB9_9STRA|nr:cytochrome b561 [Nitzschia inconspicua]
MNPTETAPLTLSLSETTVETTGEDDTSVDAWRQRLIRYQRHASLVAHLCALVSLFTVVSWINHLGGLSWKYGKSKQVFNWHPLLMITGFAFMTVASLSFRNLNRPKSKTLHGLGWTIGILCMIIALFAVFRSHNDPISGFIANMYSMHSWIGMFVFVLYTIQFVSGMVSFGFPVAWRWGNGMPIASESFKSRLLLVHHFFGPFIYLSLMATILMGIQEKEGFVGCAYDVKQVDRFPHFYEIPLVCKVSHFLGFLVFLTGMSTSFALYPIDRGMYRQN